MTIKIRRLIFYSLIAAFVVLAFIIIPYSNGWVFNFKTFTFAQLGGIYLEVDPSDSLISVDGLKVQIKPSFFRNGVLVANLFPKTYHVSVTKQNYQFWNGGVAVSPSLVTQIHPIVLLPEKLQKNIIANNVKSIFLNSNILAFEDKNNSIKVSGKSIRGTEFVSWLSGDTFIITFDKNTGNYFATNVNDHTALNINLIFNNLKNQRSINDTSKISNVGAYPADGNKVILTTSKSIYALDINKISLKVIKPGRYDLLATENGKIYFSDSQNIYSYDIGTQMMSTLAPETASVAELSPDGHFFAFSNENGTFLLDQSDSANKPVKLSGISSTYFKFSPDSKKIAMIGEDNKSVNVFFIGDDYDIFAKKPMSSSVFRTDVLDKDYPISWFNNSAYLFVKHSSSLDLFEINDTDPPKNRQIVDSAVDKYFYYQANNTLYLLSDGSLYTSIIN